ncbi:unnamed protein product, partial [Nesidiocoris tenuis]
MPLTKYLTSNLFWNPSKLKTYESTRTWYFVQKLPKGQNFRSDSDLCNSYLTSEFTWSGSFADEKFVYLSVAPRVMREVIEREE